MGMRFRIVLTKILFLVLILTLFLSSSGSTHLWTLPGQSAMAQPKTTTINHYPLEYNNNHSQSVQQLTNRFSTYENPTLGVTIEYPPQWSFSESGRAVTFSTPFENASDTYQENLLINVHPSQNQTLDNFVNNDTNYYQQNYKDFKLLSKRASINNPIVKTNLG